MRNLDMGRLWKITFLLSALLLLVSCQQTPPSPASACWQPPGAPLTAPLTSSKPAAPLGDFTKPHVPGEILVKGDLSVSDWGQLGALSVEPVLKGWHRVLVPPGTEEETAREALKKGALVAEPNYLARPLVQPNDPFYLSKQRSYLHGLMHLESVWDRERGDADLTIAVIDSGYLDHPEIVSRLYLPAGVKLDTADEDTDPTDDTSNTAYSHGTEVMSALGAVTNNNAGIAGVTWQGKLLPIKVFPNGKDTASVEDIAEAVIVAQEQGAKLVNLSLGFSGSSNLIEEQLKQGWNKGTIFVAASGNAGNQDVYYPAKSQYTIAVGAVDLSGVRAYFSNYGPELDLVAPGVGIYLAYSTDGYGLGDGTSFAAPLATGAIALYMSAYKKRYGVWPSPNRVYSCATQTAEDLGPRGRDEEYGSGLIRPDRMLSTP